MLFLLRVWSLLCFMVYYSNESIFERFKEYRWDFLIILLHYLFIFQLNNTISNYEEKIIKLNN